MTNIAPSLCRDMVKRLINKMDFEALEVKMKKCKVCC